MASTTGSKVCPDWIYSATSTVHVARDKAWFDADSYVPFKGSKVFPKVAQDAGMPVLGIGDVRIPVWLSEGEDSVLRLKDVLHVPTTFCNVINANDIPDCKPADPAKKAITDNSDKLLGRLEDKSGVSRLIVSEPWQAKGILGLEYDKSVVDSQGEGRGLVMNLVWSDDDRSRWMSAKKLLGL